MVGEFSFADLQLFQVVDVCSGAVKVIPSFLLLHLTCIAPAGLTWWSSHAIGLAGQVQVPAARRPPRSQCAQALASSCLLPLCSRFCVRFRSRWPQEHRCLPLERSPLQVRLRQQGVDAMEREHWRGMCSERICSIWQLLLMHRLQATFMLLHDVSHGATHVRPRAAPEEIPVRRAAALPCSQRATPVALRILEC